MSPYTNMTFINPKTYKLHKIGVSSGHYQLKNNLKSTNYNFLSKKSTKRKYLIFPNKNFISSYDISNKALNNIISTKNLKITSIDVCFNIICYGTTEGYLYLIINSKILFKKVTDTLINCVTICENKIYIGDNTNFIKILNLNLEEINTIYTESFTNNIILNNNYLIVTLDNNKIKFYENIKIDKNFEPDNNKKFSIDTLGQGFGLGVNLNRNLLSVATDDGFVCFYNLNNIFKNSLFDKIKPENILQSSSYVDCLNINIPYRCLTLMNNNYDLMIITQDKGKFEIFDLRRNNLYKRQIIDLINSNKDNYDIDINGIVSFDCDCKYSGRIFVATNNNIIEYKVDKFRRLRMK